MICVPAPGYRQHPTPTDQPNTHRPFPPRYILYPAEPQGTLPGYIQPHSPHPPEKPISCSPSICTATHHTHRLASASQNPQKALWDGRGNKKEEEKKPTFDCSPRKSKTPCFPRRHHASGASCTGPSLKGRSDSSRRCWASSSRAGWPWRPCCHTP